MYFFDKKTMYLIWKMQEGQARGVGTVRFLVMDEVCRMEIAITACGKVQGTYPVYVLSGHMQSLLGEIVLNKGKGTLSVKCNANRLGHLAFPYTQVTGLHIDLKSEGCLEQKWLPVQEQMVEKRMRAEKAEEQEEMVSGTGKSEHLESDIAQAIWEERSSGLAVKEESPKKQYEQRESSTVQKSNMLESERTIETEHRKVGGSEGEQSEKARDERPWSEKPQSEKPRDERPRNERPQNENPHAPIKDTIKDAVKPPEKEGFQLYPNKWQQLCAIYPVVHPFGDGRAYLSIEPRDFVVLQERFQPMVQNSFLLHGFYHYRHLLLGRQKQGKYVQYYLGVPGVFYEKEKSAALFYGFESFEGAVTPTPEGSFGYYMKRVQI